MTDRTNESHTDLIIAISGILLKNGLKSTTMDSVASALAMSKRTLYEIFESKKDMILKVVSYWQHQHRTKIEGIFADSKNVMEALVRAFYSHQQIMKEVNVDFFLDMDKHFPEVRKALEQHDRLWIDKMMIAINKGIEQGVFRTDVNYPVTLHLMRIQMESLKRTEEVFPPGITISDAFSAISISFLRAIATPEGMKIIDEFYRQHSEYINSNITTNQS
ncbi:MAG: TetR/AcrR family transcriptional regulator [Bacteroides sp.]|nr:TetR/AcrR family transcriptional regulator [Bacteroides sp.]